MLCTQKRRNSSSEYGTFTFRGLPGGNSLLSSFAEGIGFRLFGLCFPLSEATTGVISFNKEFNPLAGDSRVSSVDVR